MFSATVYDDGKKDTAIEVFQDECELKVVHKATNAVKYLRNCGKDALGRYTFRLTKDRV